MSVLTALYALVFYLAATVLVLGLAVKIRQYWMTPVPFKIPTTPAPITRGGVVLRMGREVLFFESLFKSNKWTWIFAAMFHAGLALVLLRHFRYFIEPVWTWLVLMQDIGIYAGFALVAGLGGLWARRILVNRVRYISGPSDHLMLMLIIGIGLSGLAMRYGIRTDIIAVKAFFLGMMRFDIQPLPTDPVLLLHLGLVAALMIVFPFSKLLHGVGLLFSPTRNQVDNPRERRHLAPWAAGLDAGAPEPAKSRGAAGDG